MGHRAVSDLLPRADVPATARPADATLQFQNLLANSSLRPDSIYVALAHLGLARASGMNGNSTTARTQFETFFTLWQDADSDVPLLQQARAEYAHLLSVQKTVGNHGAGRGTRPPGRAHFTSLDG